MLRPGLVSITFRDLPAERVLDLAVDAGLAAIEWGGDVHVPHGDLDTAHRIGDLTRAAGLAVPTYGSYLRCGVDSSSSPDAAAVVDTAAALGAEAVRVWAGDLSSAAADASDRRRVEAALRAACDHAAERMPGGTVVTECHANTLTDTAASAEALLDAVDRPNLRTLWQPWNEVPVTDCVAGLRRLLPRVTHLHVFQWRTGPADQISLGSRAAVTAWSAYLAALDARDRFALLEFVPGGRPELLAAEAGALRALCGIVEGVDRP